MELKTVRKIQLNFGLVQVMIISMIKPRGIVLNVFVKNVQTNLTGQKMKGGHGKRFLLKSMSFYRYFVADQRRSSGSDRNEWWRQHMARTHSDNADVWRVLDVMEITDALKGQRVCITGHLGLARHEVQAIIQKAGGEVHDSIKWNTTILVTNKDWTAGTVDGASSKFRKAQANGTKIVNEQAFIDYIVEHGKTAAGE